MVAMLAGNGAIVRAVIGDAALAISATTVAPDVSCRMSDARDRRLRARRRFAGCRGATRKLSAIAVTAYANPEDRVPRWLPAFRTTSPTGRCTCSRSPLRARRGNQRPPTGRLGSQN